VVKVTQSVPHSAPVKERIIEAAAGRSVVPIRAAKIAAAMTAPIVTIAQIVAIVPIGTEATTGPAGARGVRLIPIESHLQLEVTARAKTGRHGPMQSVAAADPTGVSAANVPAEAAVARDPADSEQKSPTNAAAEVLRKGPTRAAAQARAIAALREVMKEVKATQSALGSVIAERRIANASPGTPARTSDPQAVASGPSAALAGIKATGRNARPIRGVLNQAAVAIPRGAAEAEAAGHIKTESREAFKNPLDGRRISRAVTTRAAAVLQREKNRGLAETSAPRAVANAGPHKAPGLRAPRAKTAVAQAKPGLGNVNLTPHQRAAERLGNLLASFPGSAYPIFVISALEFQVQRNVARYETIW
jgi:hypothetical protein